jgi:peptide/nickel transport system permease protein
VAPTLLRVARPLARLVLTTATVLFLASVITFALGALSKSNPAAAVLGETATPRDIALMDHQFGLDRPLVPRYLDWVGGALHGDLGRSWFTTVPVSSSIKQALPVDLSIALLALVLAVLLGASAGIGAALRQGGVLDRVVTVVCSVLGTLPPFVIGIGLIVLLAVKARLLPAGGYVAFSADPVQWLRFAFLPGLALSLEVAANIARQLRTSLVGALAENYAVGAEMRGYSRRRVLFGHVLRNAVSPTLAVVGMALPLIIGGAVMTEKLFNLPGIAQLALQSAQRGDVPVVLGTLVVTSVIVLAGSLVINALQVFLDPAARRGVTGGVR